jgi:ABC-2 type transport system permease protein
MSKMVKLLKVSYLSVKNIVRSRESLLLLIAAFAYSIMWVILVNIRSMKSFGLIDHTCEFGRFLFVAILYISASILRNDIRANATKTLFTGVFTRSQIMLSKIISLIMLSVFISIIVEINSLLVAILSPNKIGISGFLSINHLQVIITYSVVTFSMGALMIFIMSIIFSEKKSILFIILILSALNFYNAAFVTMASREPLFAEKISIYAKTPFYIWTDSTMALTTGILNIQQLLIAVVYGVGFSVLSIFIINKREIK